MRPSFLRPLSPFLLCLLALPLATACASPPAATPTPAPREVLTVAPSASIAPSAPPQTTVPAASALEVRAREGANLVKARRLQWTCEHDEPKDHSGFAPAIEGPAAQRMAPNISLQTLLRIDENELRNDGCGTTGIDFEVKFHDTHVVTLYAHVQTMGAYPSGYGTIATLLWATGAKVGADAFRADKKRELVKLLDARVHEAWRTTKRSYAKAPKDPNNCGPDVVSGFMDGEGPSFDEGRFAGVYVTESGLDFNFGYDFPHVVQACAPVVDLKLQWATARAYLDAQGPLGHALK